MSGPARRFAARMALLSGVLALAQGCSLTLTRNRWGEPIDVEAVRTLRLGESRLRDALHVLGAPIEVHAQADGRALVYRFKVTKAVEFGIDGGMVTQFVVVAQIAASIIENIKFTWERIHTDEDRVVLFFDRDGILRGIGQRDKTKDLPWF